MSAVGRRAVLCRYARPFEVAAAMPCRRGRMTSNRRPPHRTVWRDTTTVQSLVTAHAAFPSTPDSPCAFTPRSGMIEGVTAEVVAMRKLAPYPVAAFEPAATHHVDRSWIVSKR